jgi:hypothetical protein
MVKKEDVMKGIHESYRVTLRNCDALVLGYDPKEVLTAETFYIPDRNNVEEAFGYSLRKVLGEKKGIYWEYIGWIAVKHLDKLEKRILEGIEEVTGGDREYMTTFSHYLSSMSGRFENHFTYGKGTFYRFLGKQREQALKDFEDYWTKREKSRWQEIHKFMREHTQKQFKQKHI